MERTNPGHHRQLGEGDVLGQVGVGHSRARVTDGGAAINGRDAIRPRA